MEYLTEGSEQFAGGACPDGGPRPDPSGPVRPAQGGRVRPGRLEYSDRRDLITYEGLHVYKGARRVAHKHISAALDEALVDYLEARLPNDEPSELGGYGAVEVYAASEYVLINHTQRREERVTLADGTPGPEVPLGR